MEIASESRKKRACNSTLLFDRFPRRVWRKRHAREKNYHMERKWTSLDPPRRHCCSKWTRANVVSERVITRNIGCDPFDPKENHIAFSFAASRDFTIARPRGKFEKKDWKTRILLTGLRSGPIASEEDARARARAINGLPVVLGFVFSLDSLSLSIRD